MSTEPLPNNLHSLRRLRPSRVTSCLRRRPLRLNEQVPYPARLSSWTLSPLRAIMTLGRWNIRRRPVALPGRLGGCPQTRSQPTRVVCTCTYLSIVNGLGSVESHPTPHSQLEVSSGVLRWFLDLGTLIEGDSAQPSESRYICGWGY
jgi:hypothetical protein